MAAAVIRCLVGRLPHLPRGRSPTASTPCPAPTCGPSGGRRAPVSPAEFRAILGNFASGVTVITAPAAEGEEGPAGFACQSFASLSLDPPLVTFMVARTSTTWPRIARAGVSASTSSGPSRASCAGPSR
ncbi:Flavin-dependent monooxygenase, reductase subunit HsaB OS=Streptomyces lavendulae subsp. lavendulae OX=58340 GN=hsaB1 PE=3 SV=1 [Streptomyces lavendulae subsp. lavendulae]